MAMRRAPIRHDLKIWPEQFRKVRAGLKTAEWRIDDRDFQAGDQIVMREWVPAAGVYTQQAVRVEVTDVARGGQFGMPTGYVMLSIRKMLPIPGVAMD